MNSVSSNRQENNGCILCICTQNILIIPATCSSYRSQEFRTSLRLCTSSDWRKVTPTRNKQVTRDPKIYSYSVWSGLCQSQFFPIHSLPASRHWESISIIVFKPVNIYVLYHQANNMIFLNLLMCLRKMESNNMRSEKFLQLSFRDCIWLSQKQP